MRFRLAMCRVDRASRRSVVRVKRTRITSTVLASVAYDDSMAVLELEFASGDVYRYFAVPPSVHRGLLAAESAGTFFAERIRPVYPTEQLR